MVQKKKALVMNLFRTGIETFNGLVGNVQEGAKPQAESRTAGEELSELIEKYAELNSARGQLAQRAGKSAGVHGPIIAYRRALPAGADNAIISATDAPVAQRIERQPSKLCVGSSSLSGRRPPGRFFLLR